MLDFRLRAYRKWLTMEEPDWSDNKYPQIDYNAYYYYSEPKQKAPIPTPGRPRPQTPPLTAAAAGGVAQEKKASLDEVDPELLATFDKLGIPLNEQKRLANVAVDAVFDSVSIATTFREELSKAGVIFCSISEAVREYPDLVRRYMGSVARTGPPPRPHGYFSPTHSRVAVARASRNRGGAGGGG